MRPPYSTFNRLLLVGHMLATGTATEGELIRVDDRAAAMFGNGSMLAEMALAAHSQVPSQEVWAIPVAEPTAGSPAKAAATVTFDDTVFPLGKEATLAFYLCGTYVPISVSATDTEDDAATKLVSAIGKGYWLGAVNMLFPFTAAVGGTGSENIVTLTARHKGAAGNSMSVDVCLTPSDDKTALTCVTITAFSSGAGTVDMAATLAVLGDEEFDTIAAPFDDTTALNDLHDFLLARQAPSKMIYGHYVTASYDTYANLVTKGTARNSEFATILGMQRLAVPSWRYIAAAATAIQANMATNWRSRPLVGVALRGITARYTTDEFDFDERDGLLRYSIAPCRIRRDRTVLLDRVITTFRTTPEGVPDKTWLDIQTRYCVVFVVRRVSGFLSQRYRRRTVDLPTSTNPGVAEEIKADLIHMYARLAEQGIVDDVDGFRQRVRVEYDSEFDDRINIYLPIDVRSGLYVMAINATAFLRYRLAA